VSGSPSYAIETDVPVPAGASAGRPPKYPFSAMLVGHSFFAPGVKRSTLEQAARRASIVLGTRYVVRETTEQGRTGARCWRVE
jgi:hypothetical protein